MALKNVFGYLGLSALCGYEGLNEDKRLLPDGATLLEQSRFTYGGAIHSSVELFLTDNLLFVLKAQWRLPFGSRAEGQSPLSFEDEEQIVSKEQFYRAMYRPSISKARLLKECSSIG